MDQSGPVFPAAPAVNKRHGHSLITFVGNFVPNLVEMPRLSSPNEPN